MDLSLIQQIAQGVVDASAACDGQLYTGIVTSEKPLKIQLSEEAGSVELDGDDIILTESVVSKKLYIKKHTHGENEQLTDTTATVTSGTGAGGTVGFIPAGETLPLKHKHENETTVVDAWVTEYGHKLGTKKDDEQICITINRSLQKGDSVIMSRVSHGQQFVVLSRYFPVDNQGDEDDD